MRENNKQKMRGGAGADLWFQGRSAVDPKSPEPIRGGGSTRGRSGIDARGEHPVSSWGLIWGRCASDPGSMRGRSGVDPGPTRGRSGMGRPRAAGGSDSMRQPLASGVVFDPPSGAWEALPSMSEARFHHAAAVVGHRLFAISGCGAGAATPPPPRASATRARAGRRVGRAGLRGACRARHGLPGGAWVPAACAS